VMEKVREVFAGVTTKWNSLPVALRIAVGVTAGSVALYAGFKVSLFSYRNRRLPVLLYRMSWMKPVFDEKAQEARVKVYAEQDMRDTDIIVAVPPKSGTTWTQHMLHQIRMHAQPPTFNDQNDVMPWLELGGAMTGLDVPAGQVEQPAEPRVFKSHLKYQQLKDWGVQGKCRIVYVYRDLKDATVSAWKFMIPLLGIPYEDIPLSTFGLLGILEAEDHLKSLVDFWEHRHDDDILFFLFEEMRGDHENVVKKLAEFAEIELEDGELEEVIEQTSHKVMSNEDNWHRFAELDTAKHFAETVGFEYRPDLLTGKVRKDGGVSGQGKQELPDWVKRKLDQLWKKVVTAKLGFETYDDMREAWRQENS